MSLLLLFLGGAPPATVEQWKPHYTDGVLFLKGLRAAQQLAYAADQWIELIVAEDNLYDTVTPIQVFWKGSTVTTDRIVLAFEGATAGDFVDWVYTNGTQVLPLSVTPTGFHTFIMTRPAGTLVARILSGFP